MRQYARIYLVKGRHKVDGFFVYVYIRHRDAQFFLEPAPGAVNPGGFFPPRIHPVPVNLSVKKVSEPFRAYSDKVYRALRGDWKKNHETLFYKGHLKDGLSQLPQSLALGVHFTF